MTLYGAMAAALVRKLKAVVAEYRKLVAEANVTEKQIVAMVKMDVKSVYVNARVKEREIANKVIADIEALKAELINKIAKV